MGGLRGSLSKSLDRLERRMGAGIFPLDDRKAGVVGVTRAESNVKVDSEEKLSDGEGGIGGSTGAVRKTRVGAFFLTFKGGGAGKRARGSWPAVSLGKGGNSGSLISTSL